MTNGSEHAFPHMHYSPSGATVIRLEGGISKREYFAGLAMLGLQMHPTFGQNDPEWLAENAAIQADELLKELEKEKP